MIFFVIDSTIKGQKNFTSITTSCPDAQNSATVKIAELISWNEVPAYSTLANFQKAVIAEAKLDPVCLDMCKQALDSFGIDPFMVACGGKNLNIATMTEIVDKTFLQWAHPMIGNIGASPEVRPEIYHFQYLANWDQCTFIDAATKLSIVQLYKDLEPLERSGRDQVRICYNITEIARAIIGEITTNASKRLDKIFALQLCVSNKFDKGQIALVLQITKALGTNLKKGFLTEAGREKVQGLAKTEYIKYYFPDSLQQVMTASNFEPQWFLYENLLKIATDDGYVVTSTYVPVGGTKLIIDTSIADWKKLPGPMRCTVLINSFRRFVDLAKCNTKYSLGLTDTTAITNKVLGVPYKIVKAAGIKHVPRISFNTSGRSLTWSWNRDEYDLATITYRHFLMPLWGGPSGHGTGNVKFVENVLLNAFSVDGPNAVLTGLFAFWRLYYDKRISVVHTLAETLEGSLVYSGYTPDSQGVLSLAKMPDVSKIVDAFDLVDCCKVTGNKDYYNFVDPIKLMWSVRNKYYNLSTLGGDHQKAYDDLQAQIDALRKAITQKGFNVPQWSKELSTKTGMSVRSFAYSQTNTRSDLALTMFCRAFVNDIVSTVFDKLSTQ